MSALRFRLIAVCCGLAGLLPGCSDQESEPLERSSTTTASGSVHEPFAEKNCVSCHATEKSRRLRGDFMSSCRECHADYFTARVAHEPVAEGKCRECHTMHRSRFPDLLKSEMYASCMRCHKSVGQLSAEAHRVEDVRNCTRCHDPHFGAKALLKTQRST